MLIPSAFTAAYAPQFSGSLILDDDSVKLVRGNRTARNFRKAVDYFEPMVKKLPVDINVHSRTKAELGGFYDVDEAVVTFSTPTPAQGEAQKPIVFEREYGWYGFLESPMTFLKRVVQNVNIPQKTNPPKQTP